MNAQTKVRSDYVNITAIMQNEGIRDITMRPKWQGGGFFVTLNCGGHAGIGDTVGAAFDDAMAKNADFLHLRVTA